MANKFGPCRMGDKVVKVTYYNADGERVSTDILPPRKIYTTKDGKREFIIVTKNNIDYRCHVEEGDTQGYKCLVGSVNLPGGTRRSIFKKTSVTMDPYMVEAIRLLSDKERMNQAESIRCLISWGIESLEKKYGID